MWITWVWLIFAAVFIVGEIFTAGFFLICFGIGAAAAGIVSMIDVHPLWQWAAFVILSALSFAFSRKFSEKITKKQPKGIGADRLIGLKGIVTEKIDPLENTGLVRIENEIWRANSEKEEIIEKDEEVEVLEIKGVHLIVKKTRERSLK
ncbi:NfeD family protein [candidate division WOR-3 bacterium]|nr:NfeD family protein [candidate division WOR-3 bacterium]